MKELMQLAFIIGTGICIKNAYSCYQAWEQSRLGSALVNGLAGLAGQRTNIDLGADARNEFFFWTLGAVVCMSLAFSASKKKS